MSASPLPPPPKWIILRARLCVTRVQVDGDSENKNFNPIHI
jgi:hypothetical protein